MSGMSGNSGDNGGATGPTSCIRERSATFDDECSNSNTDEFVLEKGCGETKVAAVAMDQETAEKWNQFSPLLQKFIKTPFINTDDKNLRGLKLAEDFQLDDISSFFSVKQFSRA